MLQLHSISRHRHHALHQVHRGIDRIVKDDQVSAMNARRRQHPRERPFRFIRLFVDHQEIAHAQRRHHRLRRNTKWLQDERQRKQRNHKKLEQRAEGRQHAIMRLRRRLRASCTILLSLLQPSIRRNEDVRHHAACSLLPAPTSCGSGSVQCFSASSAAFCCASFLLAPSAEDSTETAPSGPSMRASTLKRR